MYDRLNKWLVSIKNFDNTVIIELEKIRQN